MRLFIGLPLPDALKAKIAEAVPRLSGGKIVPPDNLHLTLAFIGEVGEAAAEDLAIALGEIRAQRFSLPVGGAGTFPPRGSPRVLWFAAEQAEPLVELKAQIDDALLAAIDLEPEARPFHPHVTVARLKKPRREEVDEAKARLAAIEAEPLPVEAFVVYQSILTSNGAIYRVFRRYELA